MHYSVCYHATNSLFEGYTRFVGSGSIAMLHVLEPILAIPSIHRVSGQSRRASRNAIVDQQRPVIDITPRKNVEVLLQLPRIMRRTPLVGKTSRIIHDRHAPYLNVVANTAPGRCRWFIGKASHSLAVIR